MIVVEGFDGSGKSTIAQAIGALLGWPVVHAGGPPEDENDVSMCLARSCLRMREPCIQDRITHVSESVYSMLVNPDRAALAISALHEVRDITLIYCRPPTDVLLRNIETHIAKPHETLEHVRRVTQTARELILIYDTILAVVKPRCHVFTYDWTNPRLSHTLFNDMKERFYERA